MEVNWVSQADHRGTKFSMKRCLVRVASHLLAPRRLIPELSTHLRQLLEIVPKWTWSQWELESIDLIVSKVDGSSVDEDSSSAVFLEWIPKLEDHGWKWTVCEIRGLLQKWGIIATMRFMIERQSSFFLLPVYSHRWWGYSSLRKIQVSQRQQVQSFVRCTAKTLLPVINLYQIRKDRRNRKSACFSTHRKWFLQL